MLEADHTASYKTLMPEVNKAAFNIMPMSILGADRAAFNAMPTLQTDRAAFNAMSMSETDVMALHAMTISNTMSRLEPLGKSFRLQVFGCVNSYCAQYLSTIMSLFLCLTYVIS